MRVSFHAPDGSSPSVGRRWRLGMAAVILVILLLAGCGRRASTALLLDVRACDSQKSLLRLKVRPETQFSVWFFHSYDRAPFEEHYRVAGPDHIRLTHMTFRSSLNGQGFAVGTYRAQPDGSAALVDIDQDLDQVHFQLGSPDMANHTLRIHDPPNPDRVYRLLDVAEAGDLICITVRSP